MATSTTSEIKKLLNMKARRLFTLFSLAILSLTESFGQAPNWVPGIPTATPYAINIVANFGIDVPGTVYGFLLPFDLGATLTGPQVKGYALAPVIIDRIRDIVRVVSGGNVGITLNELLENDFLSTPLNPNTVYSIFLVAESSPGSFSSVQKIVVITPACVALNVATSRYAPVECVLKGITFLLDIPGVNPNPQISGVYKGTTWNINWGDVSPDMNYTSTTNGDFPSAALRTHPYSAITNCVYT